MQGQIYDTINGNVYGVPIGRGANILQYNSEVVTETPTSWDIVWEADSPYAGQITAYDAPIYIADAALYLMKKNPALGMLMFNPFALTPGFTGPAQPTGMDKHLDPDLGQEVGPFMMATINTKNVHRSNLLQGHPWGADFTYDEMSVVVPGADTSFTSLGGADAPKPGEGPSKEEREAGFYDLLFIGIDANGEQVRGSVHGDKDPGYGSTSKLIAETAICLVKDRPTSRAACGFPGRRWARPWSTAFMPTPV